MRVGNEWLRGEVEAARLASTGPAGARHLKWNDASGWGRGAGAGDDQAIAKGGCPVRLERCRIWIVDA